MKRIIVLITAIVLLVSMVFCLAGCDNKKPVDNGDKPIDGGDKPGIAPAHATTMADAYGEYTLHTYAEYTLDEGFNPDLVRIESYSPATGWVFADENAPFDTQKPTMIFAHGMGTGMHSNDPHFWYESGYNVLNFWWGCMADDELYPIEEKIWQRIKQYRVGDTMYKVDGFDCTMAELYLGRYCDFFALYPSYNMPINMVGHSYGGQLTLAVATIMTMACNEHAFNPAVFPSKFTLLDPYFDNAKIPLESKWLGVEVENSSVGMAGKAIDILLENNIPVEILRTSPWVRLAAIAMGTVGAGKEDVTSEYYQLIQSRLCYTELTNPEVLQRELGLINGIERMHTISLDLYLDGYTKGAYEYEGGFVAGRNATPSHILASMGRMYLLTMTDPSHNYDEYTVVPKLTDEMDGMARIAGFVYAEGAPRAAGSRVNGVKVELLKDGAVMDTVSSTHNGFFAFDVEKDGTYALRFVADNVDTKTVRVTAEHVISVCDVDVVVR